MSKMYSKYLELKAKDSSKMYLFKSGKFYIFLGEDCENINNYVVLKKVKFSSETMKCGFPENVLQDYMRVFKNHQLNIEVIEDTHSLINYNLEKYIERIDIEKITPLKALEYLEKIKEIVNNAKRN